MKNGIQIEIQEDLSDKEKNEATIFANNFLKEYLHNGMKFNTRGGWYSYYRRGTLGQRLHGKSNLYFRRASKGRRIYQIVSGSTLSLVKGETVCDYETVNYKTKYGKYKRRYRTNETEAEIGKGCHCPKCSAQLRVSNKYTPMPVYARIGEIKG